jgi:hypothetical protein
MHGNHADRITGSTTEAGPKTSLDLLFCVFITTGPYLRRSYSVLAFPNLRLTVSVNTKETGVRNIPGRTDQKQRDPLKRRRSLVQRPQPTSGCAAWFGRWGWQPADQARPSGLEV